MFYDRRMILEASVVVVIVVLLRRLRLSTASASGAGEAGGAAVVAREMRLSTLWATAAVRLLAVVLLRHAGRQQLASCRVAGGQMDATKLKLTRRPSEA